MMKIKFKMDMMSEINYFKVFVLYKMMCEMICTVTCERYKLLDV
jgi:hypothetical protein